MYNLPMQRHFFESPLGSAMTEAKAAKKRLAGRHMANWVTAPVLACGQKDSGKSPAHEAHRATMPGWSRELPED